MLKFGLRLVTCKFLSFASIQLTYHSPSVLVFMHRIISSHHVQFALSTSLPSSKVDHLIGILNLMSIVAYLCCCAPKGDDSKKPTTQKGENSSLSDGEFSTMTDFTKQIVCIGVIGPVELKFGLRFELKSLLHCQFCFLVQNFETFQKLQWGKIF